MSESVSRHRVVILCLASDEHARESLVQSARLSARDRAQVESAATVAEATARVAALRDGDSAPAVVVLCPSGEQLEVGGVQSLTVDPRQPEQVRRVLAGFITRLFVAADPRQLCDWGDLVDIEQLVAEMTRARASAQQLGEQLRTIHRGFIDAHALTNKQAEAALVEEFDRSLGNPPRQTLVAGSVMFEEEKHIPGIWVLVEGEVQLTRRSNTEEIIFHSATVGRIVGLLAMTNRQKAFFTCRAVSDCQVIPVTWDQLDEALEKNPRLSFYFAIVMVRSLTTRLKRIVALQLEVNDLNNAVEAERDALADALRQLRLAQARLIESEKMATLGQLVAGVAHELNNPATAIRRSAEYLSEDISQLIREHPQAKRLLASLQAALGKPPLSTSEIRARREALALAIGDTELARRLIKIGITTVDEYRQALADEKGPLPQDLLSLMEHAYALGTSLRNTRNSAERIAAIVRSLRSYAKPDDNQIDEVNINEGIEETLLLFGAPIQSIKLVREYGQVPPVEGRPAQLNQVWTNLISNALDAMGASGVLTLRTEAPDPQHVRVSIIDSGRGIPPELVDRVFDLNFTTKHGGASFGLGMGLMICQQIVSRHEGTISIESVPGRTCIQVLLPVRLSTAARNALEKSPGIFQPGETGGSSSGAVQA